MNFSAPFIRRPIGTTLMAIGLLLVGIVAYRFLPVASLPTVEFPTIRVSASRPGADPATMAATVAAPLERRLGEIPGVIELTSTSSLGSSNITLQFDLTRNIDGAARDVQAALNAAATDLPSDLPTLPNFRKTNPAASPVLILALTSKTIPTSAIYDAADTVIAQRISQVSGVAEVTVSGAEQPAIRVRVNPALLASMGLAPDDVRAAIAATNAQGPNGVFDGTGVAETIGTNDQLRNAADYRALVVKVINGSVIRLSDVATVEQGTRNSRSAAWFNRQPAVLLVITKQGDANVIETVDRIRALLPEINRWISAGIDISILSDRTGTIRASVNDMQWTLAATIGLVMMVVFLFLRRVAATLAAGVTVPLSLAGTCALMWVAGFSIDNLSLMALAVSVGFVVDDAIVMIENCFRNLERGYSPLRAALAGARQIGFTVVSISLSLIAAFIPLLFMSGVIGRLFREFSVTLAFAIAISMVVSLSLTPMVCAHFVREAPSPNATWLDRAVEAVLGWMIHHYSRSLAVVLRYRVLTLIVLATTMALTVDLYIKMPKGYFPQDDTGLVFGGTQAAPDISFQSMIVLQQRAVDLVLQDPAVFGVGSSVGSGGGGGGSANQGRLFISLKPLAERDNVSTARVVDRMRTRLSNIPGLSVFMFPAQDVRAGGRQSQSQYQFTLWDPDIDELQQWLPRVQDRLKTIPGLVDVTTDRQQGGLQANVVIDRLAAARLNVPMTGRSTPRSTTPLPSARSRPSTRSATSIASSTRSARSTSATRPTSTASTSRRPVAGQVPLSSIARFERSIAPLVINHQGQFPAVTISFGLAPDMGLQQATSAITQAVAAMHLPDTLHAEFAGEARDFGRSVGAQPMLILAALIAVYIILGVLYESLAHPLTIISTLPSAGLGALLALQAFGAELTMIAFIGIILLIGIVKKNGIMLVDFALEAERQRGLPPETAIFEAARERFRPILMTTMAALLGALPLVIATGPGSELRRPLGITIIGGLLVSQILTLYTTPVIYLLLDRLHRRLWGERSVPIPRGTPPIGPPPLAGDATSAL